MGIHHWCPELRKRHLWPLIDDRRSRGRSWGNRGKALGQILRQGGYGRDGVSSCWQCRTGSCRSDGRLHWQVFHPGRGHCAIRARLKTGIAVLQCQEHPGTIRALQRYRGVGHEVRMVIKSAGTGTVSDFLVFASPFLMSFRPFQRRQPLKHRWMGIVQPHVERVRRQIAQMIAAQPCQRLC